ncbi:MAG TPA: FAD-linked oxidase C-terminal domain-containing protein, partial [Kofleriaceae bacterium]|nr:FAD-linked oxidase C-terminal domain-containing protein [Kofleriaceae bacterium]
KEINPDDLIAIVEPGVVTGTLQSLVEAQGLFYPPDPASLEFCSIGGNAATNAGGPRAFKYGVTREYVLGLEVALMGGEVLRCGRRTAKGVTGYDLVAGFIGTEGTFGVITELTVKLLPLPMAAATMLGIFDGVASAGAAISALLRDGLRPRVLELADRASIDAIRGKSRYRFPANAGAIVLLEVDGEPEVMDMVMEKIGLRCDELGALDVLAATEPADRRAVWEARRLISPSLKAAYRIKLNEDICVPRGRIVEMLARVDRVAAETDVACAVFGHAGDGNLHVNLLSNDDPSDPAVRTYLWAAARQIFAHTIELGGTLSGEHGIGITKRDYMTMEQTEQVIEWQRRWKSMWDPSGLLNPGKKLPARQKTCSE